MSQAAQIANDLDAIAPRKHDVEDEQVEDLCLGKEESILAGRRNADRVLVRLQAFLHGRGKFGFVFHYQNPHTSNVKLFILNLASARIQRLFSSRVRCFVRQWGLMLVPGAAKKVIIHVNEDTSSQHDFLYSEILQLLYSRGVAGATMIRPDAGFGSHHRMHTSGAGSADGEHLPVRIEFLESPEVVDGILPLLCELVTDGLIETHATTIVKSAQRTQPV
jgi:hypothetical protein